MNLTEYLHRPSQIFSSRHLRGVQTIRTAWGDAITCNVDEVVGRSILHHGVYDLALSEAIWRLLDPGETALDVGANIGYTAGLMAHRSGTDGRVIAVEPGPPIELLRRNVAAWSIGHAPVKVIEAALSDRNDTAELYAPQGYATNSGVCTLEARGVSVGRVRLLPLDDAGFGDLRFIKIDVEGFESAVMRGASRVLGSGGVRDVLFEEHDQYPADSHKLMLGHGYSLFLVSRRFLGPVLSPPGAPQSNRWPNNYLATRDPDRALSRYAAIGWRVL